MSPAIHRFYEAGLLAAVLVLSAACKTTREPAATKLPPVPRGTSAASASLTVSVPAQVPREAITLTDAIQLTHARNLRTAVYETRSEAATAVAVAARIREEPEARLQADRDAIAAGVRYTFADRARQQEAAEIAHIDAGISTEEARLEAFELTMEVYENWQALHNLTNRVELAESRVQLCAESYALSKMLVDRQLETVPELLRPARTHLESMTEQAELHRRLRTARRKLAARLQLPPPNEKTFLLEEGDLEPPFAVAACEDPGFVENALSQHPELKILRAQCEQTEASITRIKTNDKWRYSFVQADYEADSATEPGTLTARLGITMPLHGDRHKTLAAEEARYHHQLTLLEDTKKRLRQRISAAAQEYAAASRAIDDYRQQTAAMVEEIEATAASLNGEGNSVVAEKESLHAKLAVLERAEYLLLLQDVQEVRLLDVMRAVGDYRP